MELAKENERLLSQLAKASKKIRELKEAEMDLQADCINLEKQIESERDKFAIEQQIKALENAINTLSLYGLGSTGAASDLMDDIEHLRNLIDSDKT